MNSSFTVNLAPAIMAEPSSSIFISEDGGSSVVNLLQVAGVDEGTLTEVLSTFDQNNLFKVPTEDINMYSDLITFDQDKNLTTLLPMVTLGSAERPDNRTSSAAPSPGYEDTSESSLYSSSPVSVSSSSSEDNITQVVSPEDILDITMPVPVVASQSPLLSTSSSSEESIILVRPPKNVLGQQVPLKRKRGRKPKSETGECVPPKPKKARKTKTYELDQPFEDEAKERKRQNAIRAKLHRDLEKQKTKDTEKDIEDVKNERDSLKKEVETLQENQVKLTQQLNIFKQHFGNQAQSVAALLQTGQVTFEDNLQGH